MGRGAAAGRRRRRAALGGPWSALGDPGYGGAAAEYLLPQPIEARWHGTLAELESAIRGDTPAATVRALCEVIPDRFEYRAGVTYVGSTVEDLLEGGAGVCQDFAHLSLALLRDLGIAARYVSGYFYATSDDEVDAASAEVQTHAWIEALVPGDREPIWVSADPTNRTLGGESHVKIGHGRQYSDVPPIKGVYRGTAGSELSASVRMTRSDVAPSRA